jgi:hypothetical protein
MTSRIKKLYMTQNIHFNTLYPDDTAVDFSKMSVLSTISYAQKHNPATVACKTTTVETS